MVSSVGFVVTDASYGVAYYRAKLPALAVEALGHDVIMSDIVRQTPAGTIACGVVSTDENAPELAIEPDVIVLVGGVTYDLDPAWIVEARDAGQRVLVDCDDLPFVPANNYAWRPDFAQRRTHAIGQANGVICSTPYLQDRLRARAHSTFVSRNTIDTSAYDDARRGNRYTQARVGHVTVGWRGGTPWHHGDLGEVKGIAHAFTDRARFVHVGHIDKRARYIGCSHEMPAALSESAINGAVVWCGECVAKREVIMLPHSFAELAGVPDVHVETRGLVPMAEYQRSLSGIDLAIVPLTAQPFNYAKSCIAGMEWTAAGVPWIASATPEYEWLDRSSTVRRPRDWSRALGRLIDNPVARADWARRQADTMEELDLSPAGPRALASWSQILDAQN